MLKVKFPIVRWDTLVKMFRASGWAAIIMGKSEVSEADAIKLVRSGVDRGINFLDNSWDYNKGESEKRVGKAVKDGNLRSRVFMMTKNDGAPKTSSTSSWTNHSGGCGRITLTSYSFTKSSASKTPTVFLRRAAPPKPRSPLKKAGKVRYIGFTGHKDPSIHLYMLKVADRHKFQFDTVQMPVNVMDLNRTKPHAMEGKWELFKTSALFDSTAHHPEGLGSTSPHVEAVKPPMS